MNGVCRNKSVEGATVGFYPAFCMVTGLDLRELETCLVPLLAEPHDRFRPFALPITGTYDYDGAIEMHDTDELVVLLDQFAARCAREGRLVVDHAKMPTKIDADTGVTELGVRNHWVLQFDEDQQQACLLDGHGLVFALIARGAWDAAIGVGERQLAAGASPAAVTINTAYLDEIYGEHLAARQQELRELTAFDAALPVLNRRWLWTEHPDRPRPLDPGNEAFTTLADEYNTALADIRRSFAEIEPIHRFLDHYERTTLAAMIEQGE